jgi:hypothetical protein
VVISESGIDDARAKAESGSGWYAVLARTGLVAKGVSFGIVGMLAIKLALGDGGKATSREGALQSLAQHSFGRVLLILLALGFGAYALWRFVQAFAEREGGGEKEALKKWGKRAGYVGRGLIYAGLTFSAIKILVGAGTNESQTQRAHKTAATILGWPAGTWIVGLAGVLLCGVAAYQGYRGISNDFLDDSKTEEMSPGVRKWITWIGTFGLLARMVVFGLVGIFVIKAAVDYDPNKAVGLDGALAKLVNHSYGSYLLGIVAAGLVAFAVYSLSDARYRRI